MSWFQEEPTLSLLLIMDAGISHDEKIIDVGGGASRLVDALCEDGYRHIGVLDLSEKALSFAMERLAKKACDVDWYVQDVTCFEPPQRFSLWHDRAVFHFLTEKGDRKKYIDVLRRALNPGGHVIIMAFALDGPKKCSGLDIVQYDAEKIQAELGDDFELIENGYEVHKTPSGKHQKFAYFHFVHKHETTPVT